MDVSNRVEMFGVGTVLPCEDALRLIRKDVERYVEACKCSGPGLQDEQWDAYEALQGKLAAIEARGGTYEIR